MRSWNLAMRLLSVLFFACAAFAAQAKFTIHEIRVEGNERYPSDAIVRAAGLAPGQRAGVEELQAACQRLVDTGLIQSARYRYKPVAADAADVSLLVTEMQNLQDARIQIPGIDEERVWAWLKENEPLVTREVPASEQATDHYARAIERYLAAQGRPAQIVSRNSGGPGGVRMTTVFRPVALPKVAALRFEGANAIPAAALEKALVPTALGMEYTEADFRELLKYNAGRLYDNVGHLRVSFPRVTVETTASGDLTVTTTVEEGPAYRIRVLQIAGDALPPLDLAKATDLKPGDTAAWEKVMLAGNNLRSALGRYGYLGAGSEIVRRLDDAARRVDVTIVLQKGRQSKFGELILKGLDSLSMGRARSLWRAKPGEPVNTDYLADYERLLMRSDEVHFRKIRSRFEPRPDSDLVDVVLTFNP
jgi:outer membrane protein insertion porin family